MNKSPEAFRTISEVADVLDVPPHVLRFWETRFTQVKPVKRGGGRRYYRPEDVRLLRGIRGLLYDDGMTIKGVQKILRERGIRHVITLGTLADGEPEPSPEAADAIAAEMAAAPPAETPDADPMAEAAGLAPRPATAADHRRPQADLFTPDADPTPRQAGTIDKPALRALVEQLRALRQVMSEEAR
jgi:DNA-binding transcriptional MerR regulator